MHPTHNTESLETKAAKRAVLNNIKWLQARMDSLDLSCPISQKMHGFYASKKNNQEIVFDWLNAGGKSPITAHINGEGYLRKVG